MDKKVKNIDLLIIGAGPAGLAASIYAARAKLNTLTIEEGLIGGQVKDSYEIENYPGLENITGTELSEKMHKHALNQGATIDEFDKICCININDKDKLVETDNFIYLPKAIIVTTGSQRRRLPIKEEIKFHGRGIHYCELCDGALYESKDLIVVGGGNSALEGANYLARYAKKVIVVNILNTLQGDKINQDKVKDNPKINIISNTKIIGAIGDNTFGGFIGKNLITNLETKIEADGSFVYIGMEPMVELFKNYIKTDENGYIITNEDMETNIKGVYAAGDIRSKKFRQITTAVGDGTIASLMAEKYISNLGGK